MRQIDGAGLYTSPASFDDQYMDEQQTETQEERVAREQREQFLVDIAEWGTE